MTVSISSAASSLKHTMPLWFAMLAMAACAERKDELQFPGGSYNGLAGHGESIFESPGMIMR